MSSEMKDATEGQPQQQQMTMPAPIEPESLNPIYANFARVNGTPEELVLDFGLNPSPFGTQPAAVKVSERLVLNYFTAKRLWAALGMAIQRHEQAFGTLETDVTRRVIPSANRRPS